MKLRGLIDEDFSNYKKPSMFLIFPYCTLKCDIENGTHECQNSSLLKEPIIEVESEKLVKRYLVNSISKSIVCGGLEPLDSFEELIDFISLFRKLCTDDIVIYTGYKKEEIENELTQLKEYDNIIVKFGRFIPNQKPHLDEILGVELISDNQFAEKIS